MVDSSRWHVYGVAAYNATNLGYSLVRYSLVRYSLVRYFLVRYSLVRYSLVRYSLVRYSLVRYSLVKYSLSWCKLASIQYQLFFTAVMFNFLSLCCDDATAWNTAVAWWGDWVYLADVNHTRRNNIYKGRWPPKWRKMKIILKTNQNYTQHHHTSHIRLNPLL